MSRAASCMITLLVVALAALDALARPILTEAGANAWWLVSERAPINNPFITEQQSWGDVRRLDLDSGIWTPVIPLTRQPISIAGVDDRLAVIFDDGTWSFVWPGTSMQGTRLPDRLHPLALASDGSALWFLARTGPIPIAATEADYFSLDSVPSDEIWLVSYAKAEFGKPILLMDEPMIGQPRFSIARFAQSEFAIVRHDGDGNVRWWRWSSEDGLKSLAPSESKCQSARAIAGFGKPAYFSIASDNRAQINFDQNQIVSIQCDPVFNHPDTDASVVRGELRLTRVDQNKISSQTISLDGASKSKPAPLAIGPATHGGAWLLRLVLMASLLPVLLWSFGQPPNTPIELKVKPAPIHLRALAALIDAPFLLPGPVFMLVAWLMKKAPLEGPYAEAYFALMAFSVAAYLFYTTIFEVVVGRTPGKMLFGLRVVRPDGSKPEPARLVVRNLPRVVEIMLFPSLLTMFLPSRQRVGDMIAGTVVVRDSTQNSESVNHSEPKQEGQA